MRLARTISLAASLSFPLLAQTPGSFTPSKNSLWQMPREGNILTGYHRPETRSVGLEDSVRLQNLIRDGKIYLSLDDAISLALENNLDLELERYGVRLADTDLLRSKGGYIPRGIPLSVRESPAGLGPPVPGPNGTLGGGDSPTLNSLVGPGVQIDLSQLGSLPVPTGTSIPVLDPMILGNLSTSHQSAIQNSTFLPTVESLNSNNVSANLAYQQGFTTGGTLNVFFDNLRSNQNSALSLYNPAIAMSIGVSFTQPLLRGFGFTTNRRYIRIAQNNQRVSDMVFVQQVITTVAGVVRLYWDLQSLTGDVRVREEAVASASRFVNDSQEQLKSGTFAQIDVAQAQAELARRQRDLSVTKSLVRQQEATILDYVTRGQSTEAAIGLPIVATDPLQPPGQSDARTIEQLYAIALQNRPDTKQARIQYDNAELSLHGSQSGLRPQLDVVASATNSGFAGSVADGRVVADPILNGGYGTALGQLAHNNFPTYSVGLQLALPIRNEAARSDLLRDEIAVRQQQIRIRQLEKQIHLEVTNASIALEQARETVEATRSERIFQEQALAAEQQKLEVGASTSYAVIQFQRDLAASRSSEISSLANYQKAKTALDRVLGTILDEHHVVLEDALRGDAKTGSGRIQGHQ